MQSNAKQRNQVKKVNGKETSHGQADCLQNWPIFFWNVIEFVGGV